jgi:hypothetical protein
MVIAGPMLRTERRDAAGRELPWQPVKATAIRETNPPRLMTHGQLMVALFEELSVKKALCDFRLIIILLRQLKNQLTTLRAIGRWI